MVKHNGIYDAVMEEMKTRKIYKYETFSPYFISSYVCHRFNMMNQERKVYYVGKDLPNTRLHLCFVAPPGASKTIFMHNFGGSEHAIFKNTGTNILYKQSINEASFVGTINPTNNTQRMGIAEEHDKSIILVNEFSGLTEAMKASYNTNLEVALLEALDHGRMHKAMANTQFDYQTNLTLVCGIQPSRINISGGLGRRFCYLLNIPTHDENREMRKYRSEMRNVTPNARELNELWLNIKEFKDTIHQIRSITYDESVEEQYTINGIYNFEVNIFDNLLLGYSLAKHGVEKDVVITADTEEEKMIIENQKEWRDTIQQGTDFKIIENVLKKIGAETTMYELSRDCLLYGWNISQVTSIVKHMIDAGIIEKNKNMISLTDPFAYF